MPVGQIRRARIRSEHDVSRPPRACAVPRARVPPEALAPVDVAHQAVARRHRAILRERVATEAPAAADEGVVVPQHTGRVDVEPVSQCEHAAPVHVLDVERQVRHRRPHVVTIDVRDEVEDVRVVRASRADPVPRVLDPDAEEEGVDLVDGVARRSPTIAAPRPRGEAAFEGAAGAARGVLRRHHRPAGAVVPTARAETRVLEGLGDEEATTVSGRASRRRRRRRRGAVRRGAVRGHAPVGDRRLDLRIRLASSGIARPSVRGRSAPTRVRRAPRVVDGARVPTVAGARIGADLPGATR